MQIHNLKLPHAIGVARWWHRDRDARSPVVGYEPIQVRDKDIGPLPIRRHAVGNMSKLDANPIPCDRPMRRWVIVRQGIEREPK